MTVTLAAGLFTGGMALAAGLGAQGGAASSVPYTLKAPQCSVVQELAGPDVVKRAEKGSIVQLQVLVQPAKPGSAPPIATSEIELSGQSADAGATASWTFKLMAVGLTGNTGTCGGDYAFPDNVITGSFSVGSKTGGEYVFKKEVKDRPATLEIAEQARLCLAFAAPARPHGTVQLRFGGATVSCNLPVK